MIVEKPWGTYEILLDVPERGYKVKRIVVYPYQQFSLQYHKRRTEHALRYGLRSDWDR